VEVPDSKIRPHFGEEQTLHNVPSTASEPPPASRPPTPPKDDEDDDTETAQELDAKALELHSRVDNWHGLDFSRSV